MYVQSRYVSDPIQNADTGVIIKKVTLFNENFIFRAILLLSTILTRTSTTFEGAEHYAMKLKSSTKGGLMSPNNVPNTILSIFSLGE